MAKLTKRQSEILTLIQSHMAATGSPPTRAEIAKTMGFRSPNAAEDHLRALARKGVIELVPGTSRGIRLIQSGIPIIGKLSVSQALLAEQNIEGNSRIDRNTFQPPIDFLLHITGNHLQNLNILNGDYLAIAQTNQIQSGQLVVLRNNLEMHVRRYGPETALQNPSIEGLVVGLIRPLSLTSL